MENRIPGSMKEEFEKCVRLQWMGDPKLTGLFCFYQSLKYNLEFVFPKCNNFTRQLPISEVDFNSLNLNSKEDRFLLKFIHFYFLLHIYFIFYQISVID